MNTNISINRRQFMKLSLASAATFGIGFSATGCSEVASGKGDAIIFNLWLEIAKDSSITVIVPEIDMGQGVHKALSMLIAEELDVDFENLRIRHASFAEGYRGIHTGGSTSIRSNWSAFRKAGAIARQMLIKSAALKWNVDESECLTAKGYVQLRDASKKIPYGDLVDTAQTLDLPDNVTLKSPVDFSVIGKNIPHFHTKEKVTGEFQYGIDFETPDMLVAVIRRCPVFGGTLSDFDDAKTRKLDGVEDVVKFGNKVAVLSKSYWISKKGADLLDIKWDTKGFDSLSTRSIRAELASQLPSVIQTTNDKQLEAVYEVPFQAHATMEPLSCVAYVRDGEADVWAATQSTEIALREVAQNVLNSAERFIEKMKSKMSDSRNIDNIRIHPLYPGGGFGRRLEQDFVVEAVLISKAVGKPVKTIWSREDDLMHGAYRAMGMIKASGELGENGYPKSWRFHLASTNTRRGFVDAHQRSYSIDKFEHTESEVQTLVPAGYWRSVGNSVYAFYSECFLDEMAKTSSIDPLEYRLTLLAGKSRQLAVLKKCGELFDWNKPLAQGRGKGIAYYEAYGSYIAMMVEVSIQNQGVKIEKIVSTIDCGIPVDPKNIESQVEGGIIFGLTATIKSAITLKNGRVEQSNFDNFPLIRMNEIPSIQVHVIPSMEAVGGVGELSVPIVAPAVVNAINNATGKQLRKLPIKAEDLV